MRGLFMEYPYDEQAVKIEDQFLFGEELLGTGTEKGRG